MGGVYHPQKKNNLVVHRVETQDFASLHRSLKIEKHPAMGVLCAMAPVAKIGYVDEESMQLWTLLKTVDECDLRGVC